MAGILDLMKYVQDQGDAGRARGIQSHLGKLYASAMAAPQDQRQPLIGQMAQVGGMGAATDAQAGLGKMDEATRDDLARSAGQFASIAEADPATAQQMYPALAAKAHAIGIPVPAQYDPKFLPAIQKLAGAAGASGGSVQSTYIDDQGQRVAIMRDGTHRVIGANAPNNQIIDTGNGFYGVNKGNLQAAPVMTGGQPAAQPAPGEVPFSIDPSLPPEVQASIRANPAAYAGAPDGAQVNIAPQGQQLRSAPKPPPAITPYQQAQLQMAQQRMAVAQSARDQAAAARQAADAAKADIKTQAAKARQAASVEAAQGLVDAIDSLTGSKGYGVLGSVKGSMETNVPFLRTDAKDSQAQLDNIKGQVALATMSRLKALSSQGATGFGSLSGPELHLLQNSIATLKAEDISHEQLAKSLDVIRKSMQKVANWQDGGQQPQAAPQGGTVWTRDASGKLVRSN